VKKRAVGQISCKTTTPEVRFSCVKADAIFFSIFPSGKRRFFKHFFFIIFAGGHCDGLRAPLAAAPHFAVSKN
jgi:hypothetical protein